MTEAGQRLLAAAHEALAFAKGEADPSTYVVHPPPATVDVRAIRGKMGMTQAEFGARFGFGKARIRDWEQQRTRPAASDRVLLVTIANDPNAVLRALEVHENEGKEPAQPPLAGDIAEPSHAEGKSTMRTADAGNYIKMPYRGRKAVGGQSAKRKVRAGAQKSAAG